jgi:hypothetical protein
MSITWEDSKSSNNDDNDDDGDFEVVDSYGRSLDDSLGSGN